MKKSKSTPKAIPPGKLKDLIPVGNPKAGVSNIMKTKHDTVKNTISNIH